MAGERPALLSAGVITTELEPPRIAPTMMAWVQVQERGMIPAQQAAFTTAATKSTASTKPKTAKSVPRPAAFLRSARRSSLPPSKSTMTKVRAPKKGAISIRPSRLTKPATGPRMMPTAMSQTTSGTPVLAKTISPTMPTTKMVAMANRKIETALMRWGG